MARADNGAHLRVVHVGVVGDHPGGMAQVVETLAHTPFPNLSSSTLRTTRHKRDPLSALLWIAAFVKITMTRFTGPRTVFAFHVSEGGSFIREGSLLRYSAMLGFPTFAHIHGADFNAFTRNHGRLVRSVLAKATGTVTLTTESSETVVDLLGSDYPVHITKNPVRFRPRVHSKTKTFIFCGELSERKGIDVLLEAWNQTPLAQEGWSLELYGPTVPNFEYPQIPGVVYHGVLPNRDLLRKIETASIAVLPSRAEALPIFLLEAMQAGTVPISTNVGQISELVTEQVGLLSIVGDSSDLGQKMVCLSRDPALLRELSTTARSRIYDNYRAEIVLAQLYSIWNRQAHQQSGWANG